MPPHAPCQDDLMENVYSAGPQSRLQQQSKIRELAPRWQLLCATTLTNRTLSRLTMQRLLIRWEAAPLCTAVMGDMLCVMSQHCVGIPKSSALHREVPTLPVTQHAFTEKGQWVERKGQTLPHLATQWLCHLVSIFQK